MTGVQGRWLPDPWFSVNPAYIHRCKHGSDSEVYDTEGRYKAVRVLLPWPHMSRLLLFE